MKDVQHDGDGMCVGPQGEKRWGLFGAAGMLLRAPAPDGTPLVLLQHRALWTNSGGTWGLPGGAIDSHESTIAGALREFQEETAIDLSADRVRWEGTTSVLRYNERIERTFDPAGPHVTRKGRHFFARTIHSEGVWTYTTVCADANEPLACTPEEESLELSWVPEDEVADYQLIGGLREAWEQLRTEPAELLIDMDSIFQQRGAKHVKLWKPRIAVADELVTDIALHRPWIWRKPEARPITIAGSGASTMKVDEAGSSEPGFWWAASTTAVLGKEIAGAQQVSPLPYAAQVYFNTLDCAGDAASEIQKLVLDNVAKRKNTIVVTDNDALIDQLPVDYTHVWRTAALFN